MLKGYNGNIVHVDLSTGEINYEHIGDDMARKYIGGVGFATRMLWDETTRETDPLAPEAPLIFMTGPLTGTSVPKSSRYIVAGVSPLTGIWGQAHSGGSFADELRHAGFDGIVLRGQSSRPVYLWLNNQKAEIRDAGHLWGKDTYEVSDLIQTETDDKASVACIGRAGEKLVRLAGIMNDGKQGRAAARCGLGAVMGSKKLKAIVSRGTLPISLHNENKFKEDVHNILQKFPVPKPEDAKKLTVKIFGLFITLGRMPAKNWSEGTFEQGRVYVEAMGNTKPLHCRHCPYSCGESSQEANGERSMVWEAWGPLGTNCLIANPKALQQAYSICNRYGLDTISTGAVISFAMECFEKGLITKDDADGMELTWGNYQAMIELVRKIGEREGIGKLLGEGVRKAAERIGGNASEYAMHVKGLEFPAHDPRSLSSHALDYATGSIGAAHMEAQAADNLENWMQLVEPLTFPELGVPIGLGRFDEVGKGILVAKTQDFGCLIDSLVVCLFLSLGEWVQPSDYLRLLNDATGLDMGLDEFILVGERIFNLKRMFNVRRGISRKDDILPPRILTQKLVSGGTEGYIPHIGLMLNEYYSCRGWSEEGIPTKDRLANLDLAELSVN